MLEEGALPSQVDQVLEDFGMPLGPLKVNDLSGKTLFFITVAKILKLVTYSAHIENVCRA